MSVFGRGKGGGQNIFFGMLVGIKNGVKIAWFFIFQFQRTSCRGDTTSSIFGTERSISRPCWNSIFQLFAWTSILQRANNAIANRLYPSRYENCIRAPYRNSVECKTNSIPHLRDPLIWQEVYSFILFYKPYSSPWANGLTNSYILWRSWMAWRKERVLLSSEGSFARA